MKGKQIQICYKKCLQLNRSNLMTFNAFGPLAYNVLSNFTPRIDVPEDVQCIKNMLQLCHQCFTEITSMSRHDDLWKAYYMLGKVEEKRQRIDASSFYEKSLDCLYSEHPEPPKKINYRSEKIELLYRLTSYILKYVLRPTEKHDNSVHLELITRLKTQLSRNGISEAPARNCTRYVQSSVEDDVVRILDTRFYLLFFMHYMKQR